MDDILRSPSSAVCSIHFVVGREEDRGRVDLKYYYMQERRWGIIDDVEC